MNARRLLRFAWALARPTCESFAGVALACALLVLLPIGFLIKTWRATR